jgi:hypothetical protein
MRVIIKLTFYYVLLCTDMEGSDTNKVSGTLSVVAECCTLRCECSEGGERCQGASDAVRRGSRNFHQDRRH